MEQSIYGDHLPSMIRIKEEMEGRIEELRKEMEKECGMDTIEHCLSRIKSEESMREKCIRMGLPENEDSALHKLTDAIGLRIVCAFLKDVYRVRDYIASMKDIEIVTEKDYIRHAKPNGYRSYHMILKNRDGYYIEIQLRTVSMDTWASLEHHLKYKKNISGNTELISNELKRCADELASTDVSMQAIRDLIFEDRE